MAIAGSTYRGLSLAAACKLLSKGKSQALPGRQTVFDIYGNRPRFVFFHSFRISAKGMDAIIQGRPYGTPDGWLVRQPTLKRGANLHCAYGARRLVAVGTDHSATGRFKGPPT